MARTTPHRSALGVAVIIAVMATALATAAAAPGDPGEPIKLNGPMVEGGDVKQEVAISPDGAYVVYQSDERRDTDSVFGPIYSAPLTGGPALKLSGGVVSGFAITPDSSAVVYWERNRGRLSSIPIGGGTPTVLLDDGPRGVWFPGIWISPDSTTVVFQPSPTIYRIPITGGDPIELATPVRGSAMAADVSFLVHSEASTRLRAIPVNGDDPIVLTPDFDLTHEYAISSDAQTVVYLAENARTTELYSVPSSGGTVTKLNEALPTNGDVDEFWLSPDGTRVVYRSDQDTNNVHELYSVPIGGGTVTKLSAPMTTDGDVYREATTISPDSTRVVYVADQDTNRQREVYSVPITGGAVTKLNGELPTRGDVNTRSRRDAVTITPDSTTVVYGADQDTNNVREVYSVPITGGAPTKLNGSLVTGGDVDVMPRIGFLITADSATLVYAADQDTNNVNELYAVPVSGGLPTKLNGPMVNRGDVLNGNGPFIGTTPDSAQVVYTADADTNGVREIYRVVLPG